MGRMNSDNTEGLQLHQFFAAAFFAPAQ